MRFFVLILLILSTSLSLSSQSIARQLIGTKAPMLDAEIWLNGDNNFQYKGNVTLIRWWTDQCSFCYNSAPSLINWHDSFEGDGFQVIGMYHPKPGPRKVSEKELKRFTDEKAFEFLIGLDNDWTELEKFWLSHGNPDFTSVSFLVDKKGVIRYIHPGGEYHKSDSAEHASCQLSYNELEQMIQDLLWE